MPRAGSRATASAAAPAVGKAVAEELLGGESSSTWTPYRLERFSGEIFRRPSSSEDRTSARHSSCLGGTVSPRRRGRGGTIRRCRSVPRSSPRRRTPRRCRAPFRSARAPGRKILAGGVERLPYVDGAPAVGRLVRQPEPDADPRPARTPLPIRPRGSGGARDRRLRVAEIPKNEADDHSRSGRSAGSRRFSRSRKASCSASPLTFSW